LLGVRYNGEEPTPTMLIFGDKSEIQLSFSEWRTVVSQRKAILDYVTLKSTKLEFNFGSKLYTTKFKGYHTVDPLLYIEQINTQTKEKYFLFLGLVTVQKLFEVDALISYVFGWFESNMDDIKAIFEKQKSSELEGKMLQAELDKLELKNSDLQLLCHEVVVYPLE